MNIKVEKKNAVLEDWNEDKILVAVGKSAARVNVDLTDKMVDKVLEFVRTHMRVVDGVVCVRDIHGAVEGGLRLVNREVADSYANYRNYRKDIVNMWEDLYKKSKELLYLGDRENANFNSALISTKGSLIKGYLTKELMKKFYLSKEELQAIDDGWVYIHDMRDLTFGSFNCVDQDTWITIKKNNHVRKIQVKELNSLLDISFGVNDVQDAHYYILSRTGWVRLRAVMSRQVDPSEGFYKIQTRNGLGLNVTAKHQIPVFRNEEEILIHAEDIVPGDYLLSGQCAESVVMDYSVIDLIKELSETAYGDTMYVKNLDTLKKYLNYTYGLPFNHIYEKYGEATTVKNYYRNLTVKEFKKITDVFNIPPNVLASLTLSAPGSSYQMPLHMSVTPELAKIFGYIFSDGSVTVRPGSYQICFSNTNQTLLDDFCKCVHHILPEQFISGRYQPNSTSPCINKVISNSTLTAYMSVYKKGSHDISIPDFIMNGTDSIKYAFLGAAYDGDGCFSDSMVSYATVCKKYAEQMTLLLESLGYSPILAQRENGRTSFNPGAVGWLVKMGKGADMSRFTESLNSYKSNKDYNFRESKGYNYTGDKVISITHYNEPTVVFDLETDDHWFIANGYVVHNCCLIDIAAVLNGGFEMSGIKYKEPKSLLSALQVIGDVTLVATAQQFGGFTLPELDRVLVKYARKSIIKYEKEALEYGIHDVATYVNNKVDEEIMQGIQSLEMKLNTVPCSRGDMAFVTVTFGNCDVEEDADIQRQIAAGFMKTRMKGQGNGSPVVFPKLVYLHSEKQHEDPKQEALFKLAIECSSKAMYPDYLSLDHGYVGDMYQTSGQVVSPMGRCELLPM